MYEIWYLGWDVFFTFGFPLRGIHLHWPPCGGWADDDSEDDEVCLSAAGAGRRFHSSPEFSPPECLVEAHHTTRWRCTSSTSAEHPLAAPFHTSRKRQTSRLTLWLSLQSFNKLILLLVSVLSWTTQKENWNRDFCKAIPNHPKLPKAIRFPKTLILSLFSKDDNSSTFDNLAGLVEITISISSRTSIQDEAVLHVL